MVQFLPDDLSTIPAALLSCRLPPNTQHTVLTHIVRTYTSHCGTHIPALAYIIHAYICLHNNSKVLKLKKKKDQEKTYSSTNVIFNKNKPKQLSRDDEVILSIPLLDLHTAVSRDVLGGAWLSPGWIFGRGNKIMFMCSALYPGGPCKHRG